MLKLRYLYENYELAKEILNHWEHDTENLDQMLQYYRISSNAVYPYTNRGKVCFLRFSSVKEKEKCNILGELEFLKYLKEAQYPALRVIPTIQGEEMIIVDTQWGRYYACAFEGVVGAALDDLDCTKEQMYQCGKTLGKMHRLAAEYVPENPKWTYLDALRWIAFVLKEYDAPLIVLDELEAVSEALNQLPKNKRTYGLVHYDYEVDNVFYDDKNKQCSVIDFEDGMYHFYALDLEQFFDSVAEEKGTEIAAMSLEPFLNGYRSEFEYTDEMEAARPVLRRFIDLYAYARILRSVAETFESETDWMVGLRLRLGEKLKGYEASIGEASK